jgi:hypothetical protein
MCSKPGKPTGPRIASLSRSSFMYTWPYVPGLCVLLSAAQLWVADLGFITNVQSPVSFPEFFVHYFNILHSH